MRRNLCKMGVLVAMFICFFWTQGAFAEVESIATESQEETQLQELSLLVSLQDLDFNQEGISVKVGEKSYAVYSLKKQGNQWIAKIAAGRCPWGHSLCGICNMCHKRICPDWQPRTALCAPVE